MILLPAVTILKFGRASSDLLTYGASDGSLTVCQVSDPPTVLQKLIGHSKDITDFDFSSNNQYIASCSMDKTMRVWEISKGTCIRVVYGVSSQLCICFHPVNNNLLLVGNANREINAINFSTGRIVSKLTFDDAVTALDVDHTGQLVFAGDAQHCNRFQGILDPNMLPKIGVTGAEHPCFFLSTPFPRKRRIHCHGQ